MDRLQQLEEALRSSGLSLTSQRWIVLEAMLGRGDHPTADEVFEGLKAARSGAARATVFRTLETFVELGLLRRVCHPGSSARYDPNTERHDHLVCLRCEKMVDFKEAGQGKIRLPDARRQGFHINDYSIQFRGLCDACWARRAGGAAKRRKRKKR